jgi:hypothetical protein
MRLFGSGTGRRLLLAWTVPALALAVASATGKDTEAVLPVQRGE